MMFWDRAAGLYDIFANFINKGTHRQLCSEVAALIDPSDDVLECACGTGLLTCAVAPRCKTLTATDLSENMLKHTIKKCAGYENVTVRKADIMQLDFPDGAFDKVIAGNVLHLLDEPYRALAELDRVCKPGGKLIIPTYINKDENDKTSRFARTVGKAGADFKRQFTFSSYQTFFMDAGYMDAKYMMLKGRVSCALSVITMNDKNKNKRRGKEYTS